MLKILDKNKDKLLKYDEFYDWVIEPNSQRINLIDAIKLILDFNKTIQVDLVSKYKNQKMSE